MKKLLIRLAKGLLFALACLFIYNEIFQNNDVSLWLELSSRFTLSNALYLLAILILLPLNWGLESLKWKYLVSAVQHISWKKSVLAVVHGIYFSLITPNRIGDGIGKVGILKKGNRNKGMYAFFMGSLSQLIATSFFGCVAIWIIGDYYLFNPSLWLLIKVLVTALTVALIFFYFYQPWRAKLAKWLGKLSRSSFEIQYSSHQLMSVTAYSMTRYAVFATQFYLALLFCGVELDVFSAFFCISIMYLFATWIPSFVMGELGIRESVAIVVFGVFLQEVHGVFLASLMLWTINLLVPAILGAVLFTFGQKSK